MSTLLVSPYQRDHDSMNRIFSRSNWRLHSAFGHEDAIALTRRELVPVVICVERPPDGTWKVLIEHASQSANPPRIIVTSPLDHDHLWTEALQRGAYDVLAMPWDSREVLKLNSLAWHSWAVSQTRLNSRNKPLQGNRSLVFGSSGGQQQYIPAL